MMRQWSVVAVLSAVMACSNTPADTVAAQAPDTEASAAVAFAGAWRSVTPSYEFIRLSVSSKSSEMGAFGARLTFSGVAWEGSGRIDGDSLVFNMNVAGTTQASGTLVAHSRDPKTLRLQVRTATPTMPFELTLVREN